MLQFKQCSYNKGQRDALFLNFILTNNYMFGTDFLSIIRSLITVFAAISILSYSLWWLSATEVRMELQEFRNM